MDVADGKLLESFEIFFSEFCLFARHVCPQKIELSMDKSSNGQKNLI